MLITEETIFYPQGGGQPTDVGTITSLTTKTLFNVLIVRNAPGKRTLHFGTFASPDSTFASGEEVKQEIDAQKRLLYSRIHTAGHILGLAVGKLPELIPDVVDTKAQHYPDAAYVEFKGFIDGKHKDAIQAQTDELVKQKLPVKLHCSSYFLTNCYFLYKDSGGGSYLKSMQNKSRLSSERAPNSRSLTTENKFLIC